MTKQLLADKITSFFVHFDMLGGATETEMYEATYRALESNDKDGIKIMKNYFEKFIWEDKRAYEIYSELRLYNV